MQALNLPTIMNVNPRSIYNKKEEFHKFVEEEAIDCIFMSESWERPDNPLTEIINLPNHTVISNPPQTEERGWWQTSLDHQQQQVSCQKHNTITDRYSVGGGGNLGPYLAQNYFK